MSSCKSMNTWLYTLLCVKMSFPLCTLVKASLLCTLQRRTTGEVVREMTVFCKIKEVAVI